MFNFLVKKKPLIDEILSFVGDFKEKKHIILSPHFDDAVISMGGFIISHQDKNLKIFNIFTSMPKIPVKTKWDGKCGFEDSTQAVTSRTEEDKQVFNFLNVSRDKISNLDFLDKQYRSLSDTKSLKKEIKRILLEKIFIGEDVEYCLYAPASSVNIDHQIIKDISIEIRKERKNITLFFYQDIPYITNLIEENNFYFDSLVRMLKEESEGEIIPVYGVFDKNIQRKKQEAVKIYKSQYFKLKSHLKKSDKILKKQSNFFRLSSPAEIFYLSKD